MHSRIITVFLTSGLWSAAVLALASPAFEVATVKSSPPPEGDSININLGTVRNGQLTLTNASLSDCIRFAYGLVSDAQIAGPDWVKSKAVRFDIVAKAPPDTQKHRACAGRAPGGRPDRQPPDVDATARNPALAFSEANGPRPDGTSRAV